MFMYWMNQIHFCIFSIDNLIFRKFFFHCRRDGPVKHIEGILFCCRVNFMFVKFECFHCVNYIQTHFLDVLYLFCSKLVYILHQPWPWPFKTLTAVCMVLLSLLRIVEPELICVYVYYIFKLKLLKDRKL